VNPGGLLPLAIGTVLLFLGVSGRYKQALSVLKGSPVP
jgi:hypothetical protein